MLLLETICIKEGVTLHLGYHSTRLNRTRSKLFGASDPIDLADYITPPEKGIWRCRVLYDTTIQNIHYLPYVYRPIKRLKLIESSIEYPFKFADRTSLEALFAQRGEVDDVLIVKKNRPTDTTVANVAFFDGTTWFTPAYPLLKGTTRARLLDDGFIKEADITTADLKYFKKVAIMNALIGFIPIEEIIT